MTITTEIKTTSTARYDTPVIRDEWGDRLRINVAQLIITVTPDNIAQVADQIITEVLRVDGILRDKERQNEGI